MSTRFPRFLAVLSGATLFSIIACLGALALLASPARAQSETTATNALSEAVDAPAFSFVSTANGSNGAWFSQTKLSSDGVDAVQSGATVASGKSTLTVSVTGVTQFSFRWKVSSESRRDLLTFYIDDVAQANPISGNVDWQTRTYTLTGTGSHTLRWEYSKDASVNSYSDAGWVDQFTVLAASVPTISAQPSDRAIAPGENAALSVQALGSGTLSYQWYKGESGVTSSPVDGATGPLLLTPPLTANSRFWVRITQGTQTANSRAALVTVAARRPFSLLAAGGSAEGALGLGEITESTSLAKAAVAVVRIAAGARHSLFLKSDGSLWAAGDNDSGQLGDGSQTASAAPKQIVTAGVAQIAAGESHSLFLKSDGSLWGMGSNADGELGQADTANPITTPVQISTNVAQIAAGARHSLFVKTDGSLWAAGAYGGASSSTSPVQIASQVSFAAAGKSHSLFIKTNGALWALGANESGQLGDGGTEARTSPVKVADRVVFASAGAAHSLFVRSDGFLLAMGGNAKGQLGDGTLSAGFSAQPRQISDKVVRASAGARHSFFLKTDGTLWATGDNSDGQFGNGTRVSRSTPAQVAAEVADASAADSHSLVLKTPPSHTVTFKLGEGARRTGGGTLVQSVREGEAAVAPVFTPPAGKALSKWSTDFSLITGPLTVDAVYLPTQTITFVAPATVTYGAAPLTLSATSSSGLPVVITRVSGPAELQESVLTFTGGGQVILRASCPAGELNGVTYAAAPVVERKIEVRKLSQTLTFSPPAGATYGDAPITLSATTSVPDLAVAFEVVSGPATLSGSVLTLVGAGDVVVKAKQAGTAIYAEASLTRTIKVAKKTLLVSATDTARAVAQPNPAFVLNYSGFVGDDTLAKEGVIDLQPSLVTAATLSSAPGVYIAALQGGSSANYAFALTNPAPTLTVIGYGGAYEALIDGDAHELVPSGKLELTVASRSLEYTGTLRLGAESAPLALRGTLLPSPDLNSAAHTFLRAQTASLPGLELVFTVTTEGELFGTLERAEAAPVAFADGVRLGLPLAPLGEGAHTLVLAPARDAENALVVRGHGHATAVVASKTAVLTVNGKLADGAPLTASLKPSSDRSYRLWANPYKQRAASFLAGRIALTAHPETERFPGRYFVPDSAEAELHWQKATLPESTPAAKRDATYRAGFGPLRTAIRLDPWLPPVSTSKSRVATTLAQRLGLAVDNTASASLEVLHGDEGTDLGALAASLPTALTLDAKGRIIIAAPITVPANRGAWKITRLDSSTGAFTGRFVLRDPPLSGTKTIVRNVDFSGVFVQSPASEVDAPVAAGFFLLPALDSSAERSSQTFELFEPAE